MVSLRGYHIVRQDRIGKAGGGVAFYICDQLRARTLRHSEDVYCRRPEYLVAEISTDWSSKFLLVVVYRPPHCGYLSEVFNIVADLSALYNHAIVLGDFNADLNSRSYDTESIRFFVDTMHFSLVLYEPTYHTRVSSTWLDLCIIDDADKLISYGQQDVNFLSAHDMVYIEYGFKISCFQERSVKVRDFRSFDSERFLEELGTCDWSALFDVNDVNEKVGILNEYLLECFNRHAPIRRISPKHLPAPWLTSDIRDQMRERDRARRRWRRNRTDANYDEFRVLRNRTQNLIHDAKSRYYLTAFDDLTDLSLIWKRLKYLGLIKARTTDKQLLFSIEELNEHFSGSSPSINRDEDVGNGYYLGEGEYSDIKFYWKHIEPTHVLKALKDNKSEAVGDKGLLPKLIKIGLPCILSVIVHIFNYCLEEEVYPDLWKMAVVSPIPKVKCPAELRDYRPISILCAIFKIMERIVADQIKEYLVSSDTLDQSAYRKDHSTQTALIRFLDDMRQAADARLVIIVVFFDFTKVFDNICHKILIYKLRNVGFSCSALRWI
ncbi:uncharacterized protein LOC112452356 [Temnothorax curvispinosus]|uniref:Uncharacterized protein LOC112452356 n=1 Tax=Temnothorax curvispinosus TaxID=300111 RepID=A0A6J1PFS7_9HYME|nr:uncharacterized protein LOC112452356 [Temnothorax curvispinosus]